jgi:hypothetical protein
MFEDIPSYAFITSQDYDIPSVAFKDDYFIFISKKAAPHFAEKVGVTSMKHAWGVQVWESTDKEDDLAVITIGKHAPYWKIEEDLFEYKNKDTNKDVKESGFWGQNDIGYKNKTWNLIN